MNDKEEKTVVTRWTDEYPSLNSNTIYLLEFSPLRIFRILFYYPGIVEYEIDIRYSHLKELRSFSHEIQKHLLILCSFVLFREEKKHIKRNKNKNKNEKQTNWIPDDLVKQSETEDSTKQNQRNKIH